MRTAERITATGFGILLVYITLTLHAWDGPSRACRLPTAKRAGVAQKTSSRNPGPGPARQERAADGPDSPTHQLPATTHAAVVQKTSSRVAYVFYASSHEILRAVNVNAKRLQKWAPANLNVSYVVIVPTTLSVPQKYGLVSYSHKTLNGPAGYYRACMGKLLAFNLTEYSRVVYMDADALVVKSLHPLFALPDVALAAPLAYWENENCFTTALMVITPNRALFDRLMGLVDATSQEGKADMDLLNRYFQHHLGGHSKTFPSVLMLPGTVLVLSSHFYTAVHGYHSFDKFGSSAVFPDLDALAKNAWIVHFSGDAKPWAKPRSAWTKKASNAVSQHYAAFTLEFLREYETPQPKANIAVCVPATARDIPLIPALLASIGAQTQHPAEVIVYITGVATAPQWPGNVAVRTYTEPVQKYSGYSRNACAKRANSGYVMFVDGDDQLHPERVMRVQAFIDQGYTLILNGHSDFEPAAVLSDVVVPHAKLSKSAFETPSNLPLLQMSPVGITHGHPTVKRSVVLAHRYIETFHGGEDSEFLNRILRAGAVKAVFLHAKLSITSPR